MAEATFSWRKIFSVFGSAIIFFAALATIATGGNLIYEGSAFRGIMACVSAFAGIGLAILILRDYERWSDEKRKAEKLTKK